MAKTLIQILVLGLHQKQPQSLSNVQEYHQLNQRQTQNHQKFTQLQKQMIQLRVKQTFPSDVESPNEDDKEMTD